MKEMQIRLQIKDFIVEKKFSYHNMQNNKMEKKCSCLSFDWVAANKNVLQS